MFPSVARGADDVLGDIFRLTSPVYVFMNAFVSSNLPIGAVMFKFCGGFFGAIVRCASKKYYLCLVRFFGSISNNFCETKQKSVPV